MGRSFNFSFFLQMRFRSQNEQSVIRTLTRKWRPNPSRPNGPYSYKPRATSHKPSATSHEPQASHERRTSHEPHGNEATNHKPPRATGHKPAMGHEPRAKSHETTRPRDTSHEPRGRMPLRPKVVHNRPPTRKSSRLVDVKWKILRLVETSALLLDRPLIAGRPDFDEAWKRRK